MTLAAPALSSFFKVNKDIFAISELPYLPTAIVTRPYEALLSGTPANTAKRNADHQRTMRFQKQIGRFIQRLSQYQMPLYSPSIAPLPNTAPLSPRDEPETRRSTRIPNDDASHWLTASGQEEEGSQSSQTCHFLDVLSSSVQGY